MSDVAYSASGVESGLPPIIQRWQQVRLGLFKWKYLRFPVRNQSVSSIRRP
jgi:hypothetical protein